MMHEEFERLAGYEVSFSDYHNIIEPMYMATDLSKADFIKTLNRKQFDLKVKKAALIKAMREIAEERKENCEHFTDYDAIHRLEELAEQYMEMCGYLGTFTSFTYEHWHGIKQCCTYPATLEITSRGTYRTLETVKLA